MSDWQMTTPVAFFVFNRPQTTRRVLDQIAAVEPPTLLVIADGPRENHPDDEERCAETRSLIENNVDWDCEVKRNYADRNLGLFNRFTTGLEWIFDQTSEAIILEDDCVPHEDFFRFCQTMLEEYRDDKRIMDISGSNHLGQWKNEKQDYHFSNYGGIWGWATWRRAWEWYDPKMELWKDPEVRERMRDVIADNRQCDYLEYIYKKSYESQDTWDYPWGFARHINSALSIVPSSNLVSNIGFGEQGTNTTKANSELADIPRKSLAFPINTHEFVAVDREYDKRFHRMRPISHRNRLLRMGREIYKCLRSEFF